MMRLAFIASMTMVLAFTLNCSQKQAESGGSATPPPAGQTQDPVQFVNLSSCSASSAACVEATMSTLGHRINPLLFGDGIEWKEFGLDALQPDLTLATAGTLRPEIISAMQDLRVPIMRYPGGTLADLFHWNQAVGPMAARTPQRTLDFDTATSALKTQAPHFGPDEFVQYANAIGSQILLTVNVVTGTAAEAASWVSYWKGRGVPITYVEIGNEPYLPGPGGSFPVMAPAAYAAKFNDFAVAIRAVDPNLKLGIVGISDTSFWCHPTCTGIDPWNRIVLQNLTQKADWMAVHYFYSPGSNASTDDVYRSVLASTEFHDVKTSYVLQDIQAFANVRDRGMDLAVTEHASFFIPVNEPNIDSLLAVLRSNQTLGSALFSALSFHSFIREPKMFMANHINPHSPFWQAPLVAEVPDYSTYPAVYSPRPALSIYGHIFKMYRETAGHWRVPTTAARIPQYNVPALPPLTPAINGVPFVDVLAVTEDGAAANPKGWVYLINRSLTDTQVVQLVLKGIGSGTQNIEVEQVASGDLRARNQPGASGQVIVPQRVHTSSRTAVSGNIALQLSLPKHSLLRVRISR